MLSYGLRKLIIQIRNKTLTKDNNTPKQCQIKGLETLKNQQEFNFVAEEDDCNLDDDEDDDYTEEEMKVIGDRENQLALLWQQTEKSTNNASAAPTNCKVNGTTNAGKRVSPNQNMSMKFIDPNTVAALRMNMSNNAQPTGGANVNLGEAAGVMGNDINAMMNLAGFHGNGTNNNVAAIMGGGNNISNLTGIRGFQVHPNNNVIQGSSAGFTTTGHLNPTNGMLMNMNNCGNQQYNPSLMLMNLQNRHVMQSQMMYNMSPYVPPATGYYYNYGQAPYISSYVDPSFTSPDQSTATHMFSDDNTSSCSVM